MGLLLNRLLILLNDCDIHSTNYHIALTMLRHFKELQHMSILELAQLCHVAKSKISNFIRMIGFEDYADFKASATFKIANPHFDFSYNTNIASYNDQHDFNSYIDEVMRDIHDLKESLDNLQIKKLAKHINEYDNIVSVGLLFSEIGALDLQIKLAYSGKFIRTNLDDKKQEQIINECDENTLLIIYSNSGTYIQKYVLSDFLEEKDFSKVKAKIVLITSNENMLNDENVDLCIHYHHKGTIQTHSVIYPLINDYIIKEYRQLSS